MSDPNVPDLLPQEVVQVSTAARLLNIPVNHIRQWLYTGRLTPAGERWAKNGTRFPLVRVADVLELDRRRRQSGCYRGDRNHAA